MGKVLRRSNSNPYVLETIYERLSSYIDQNLKKNASPRFKGLLITEGPLIVDGDIQYSGEINRIDSQISTFSDSSLVINFDNPNPLNTASLEIVRGGLADNVFLKYTASTSQWSLYDGITTASMAHFQNLTDSTLNTNQHYPLTLDTNTGSLVPTSTFQVPLQFQNTLTLESGYLANLQLGTDSLLQWQNGSSPPQIRLDVRDSTVLQVQNISRFQFTDATSIGLPLGNALQITSEIDHVTTTVASIRSQVAGLASAAATNGVDLLLDVGTPSTGGSVIVPSTLDSPDRSAFIIQGGQYLGRNLTFGPCDLVGANAPRLYTLGCPTINTLTIFGKEICLQPASASTNPIVSTEFNLLGVAPALRLTSSINDTCIEYAVDEAQTSSTVTVLTLQARKRIDGSPAPLNLNVSSEVTKLQGSVEIAEDLQIGGSLIQANGIDSTPTLLFSNLSNTSTVTQRLIAVSIPSTGWRQIQCTIESEMDSMDAEPFGFDIQMIDRISNFQFVGEVIVLYHTVSYDSATSYSRDVETTATAIPNTTKVRVTIEPEEILPTTTTLSFLYQAI